MDRVLCQFPLSHYCEKARWVLDFKGLPYQIRNQLPGPHALVNRLRTGRTTVPVLLEGSRAISGSHAIALHLEASDGNRPLLPQSAASRASLDETCRYFDRVVGSAVRQFAYRFITARPAMFRELFFAEYEGAARVIGLAVADPVRAAIARMYQVHAPSAVHLPDVLRAAADRVEKQLEGGAEYLLDDRFCLADLTVASIFGPIVGPPGSPWTAELDIPEFAALRAEMRARPIGTYIERQYEKHRAPV